MMEKKMILEAIRTLEGIYQGTDKPEQTVEKFVEAVGNEVAECTIATLVNRSAWDGRISSTSKEWAKTVFGAYDEDAAISAGIYSSIHCAHLDQIAKAMEEHHRAESSEEMKDKNGIEIRTGDIVEITNAYFKNDNGLWFVDCSPGDINWFGKKYSLKKISKTGKISKAKYNICFWPIWACVNSRAKTAEANRWNEAHAQIEVTTLQNLSEVISHFENEADSLDEQLTHEKRRFGEDSPIIAQLERSKDHLLQVAATVAKRYHDALELGHMEPQKYEEQTRREKALPQTAQNGPTTGEKEGAINDTVKNENGAYAPETSDLEPFPESAAKEEPGMIEAEKPAYYSINEETARRANDVNSMRDYKTGSATAQYRAEVDKAASLVEHQKQKVSPFYHDKLNRLLDRYARRLAAYYNDYYCNEAACPSILISGGSNFPVRKKEKQNARRDTLQHEYEDIQGILSEISSVGTGPIDPIDPNARAILIDRLQILQTELERGKAMNAHYRKYKTMHGFRDINDEAAAAMDKEISRAPAFAQTPYPDFELSSLRGKIKRAQDNLDKLDKMEQHKGEKDLAITFEGGKIVENIGENRLQVIFDEIPSGEMRAELKSHAFRWSPKNKAWQRKLTANALYDAKHILGIVS